MMHEIKIKPLEATKFAPFGDVISLRPTPDKIINQGRCARHHDLAHLSFMNGRAGVSLFDAAGVELPYKLAMMERHPKGSQAFLPLSARAYLVIVAPDCEGKPGLPQAFLAPPETGINYAPNVWHGVLTPLGEDARFGVIDRIGQGTNLEEYWFETPYLIIE